MIAKLIKAAVRAGLGVVLATSGRVGSGAQETAAQSAVIEGVTYEQPKVQPGEFSGDLSRLPREPTTIGAPKIYRPRLQGPPPTKFVTQPGAAPSAPEQVGGPNAPMPGTIQNFAGLSFNDSCTGGRCGAGWPPDPNGDVGPNHYIEAVNDAIAIYGKSGALLASFTEDNLWNGVGTTPCNGNSQGDPVVVYDWLADRFVITWLAFSIVSGRPASPFYQCIAASKTSDPVAGGWWLYAVRADPGGAGQPPVGDLNDYGKFGLWHDCLYMGANLFRYDATHNGTYDGVLFGSFSRADLYSGSALTFSLGQLPPTSNAFTLVPSNNQGTGANAAQPGTPNYFVSESGSAFAFEVRKFTAGANCGAGGTLSTASNVSQATYPSQQGAIVPQPNTTNRLDMIDDRIMQKVPYRKIGSAESLWVTHPVGTAAGTTAMQWAQLDVTGGTIAAAPVQQQIYAPDTTLYRFMGSLAVDRQGNMALGYTTSNGTAPNYPSIAYSGRLATDPLNTLPQTEVQMIAGSGSQTNTCPIGGAPCDRWGDYSAMSLDPADGCAFWYVNEYYDSQTDGNAGNWQTRIGSFRFPSCGSPPPPSLVNPSFEIPALGSSYQYNPSAPGIGWTFTNGGIQGNGSAWGAAPAPDGTQTAFIQSTSAISQTLSLNAGSYTLSFQAAQRACCVAPNVQPVEVMVDGIQIGSPIAPASTSFATFSIAFSVATSGAHTIMFAGTDPNDKTTFIDAVTLVAGSGASTTTMLASSPNPSTVGMNVTFTATVTGSAPTGTVGFTDGGSSISNCAAVALGGSGNTRTAQCSTSSLAVGTHSIMATYGGDAANAGSTSATLSQVVNSGSPPPSLVNPSFEIPALGSSYQYNPSAPGIGWTFTNGGIQGNGSAWGAAPAPDGTQTAFIQSTSAISQTLSLNAGSYTLSFQAAQRACCVAPNVQPVEVMVDGIQIGSPIAPASTSFATFSIAFSVATSGAHTIMFAGTDPNDKTTFIDTVTLVAGSPPPSLVNPSFEIPALGSSYQYNPSAPGIGWTFTNGGIQGNGSAWGAAPAPDGTQTAFIQSTSAISQTLSLNAGSYTLSFQAAQRACCVAPNVQPVEVMVDGIQIGSPIAPASTSFATFSIAFSVATSGAHTIMFAGTDPNDKTTFIDTVTLQ
jgi:hypothetical protein